MSAERAGGKLRDAAGVTQLDSGWNIAMTSCVVAPGTATSNGVVLGLIRSLSAPPGVNAAARWPTHAVVSPAGKPLLVLARMPPMPGGTISGSGEVAGILERRLRDAVGLFPEHRVEAVLLRLLHAADRTDTGSGRTAGDVGADEAAGLNARGKAVTHADDAHRGGHRRAGVGVERRRAERFAPASAAAGGERDGDRERRGRANSRAHSGSTVGVPRPNWICTVVALSPPRDVATELHEGRF